jgi:pectinesterase
LVLYFLMCKLVADTTAKKVYLGRPWRPYAQTVFIRCELGDHIVAEGWDPWKGDAMFPDKEKTALYAEYKNTGAGAASERKSELVQAINKTGNAKYTVTNILWDFCW